MSNNGNIINNKPLVPNLNISSFIFAPEDRKVDGTEQEISNNANDNIRSVNDSESGVHKRLSARTGRSSIRDQMTKTVGTSSEIWQNEASQVDEQFQNTQQKSQQITQDGTTASEDSIRKSFQRAYDRVRRVPMTTLMQKNVNAATNPTIAVGDPNSMTITNTVVGDSETILLNTSDRNSQQQIQRNSTTDFPTNFDSAQLPKANPYASNSIIVSPNPGRISNSNQPVVPVPLPLALSTPGSARFVVSSNLNRPSTLWATARRAVDTGMIKQIQQNQNSETNAIQNVVLDNQTNINRVSVSQVGSGQSVEFPRLSMKMPRANQIQTKSSTVKTETLIVNNQDQQIKKIQDAAVVKNPQTTDATNNVTQSQKVSQGKTQQQAKQTVSAAPKISASPKKKGVAKKISNKKKRQKQSQSEQTVVVDGVGNNNNDDDIDRQTLKQQSQKIDIQNLDAVVMKPVTNQEMEKAQKDQKTAEIKIVAKDPTPVTRSVVKPSEIKDDTSNQTSNNIESQMSIQKQQTIVPNTTNQVIDQQQNIKDFQHSNTNESAAPFNEILSAVLKESVNKQLSEERDREQETGTSQRKGVVRQNTPDRGPKFTDDTEAHTIVSAARVLAQKKQLQQIMQNKAIGLLWLQNNNSGSMNSGPGHGQQQQQNQQIWQLAQNGGTSTTQQVLNDNTNQSDGQNLLQSQAESILDQSFKLDQERIIDQQVLVPDTVVEPDLAKSRILKTEENDSKTIRCLNSLLQKYSTKEWSKSDINNLDCELDNEDTRQTEQNHNNACDLQQSETIGSGTLKRQELSRTELQQIQIGPSGPTNQGLHIDTSVGPENSASQPQSEDQSSNQTPKTPTQIRQNSNLNSLSSDTSKTSDSGPDGQKKNTLSALASKSRSQQQYSNGVKINSKQLQQKNQTSQQNQSQQGTTTGPSSSSNLNKNNLSTLSSLQKPKQVSPLAPIGGSSPSLGQSAAGSSDQTLKNQQSSNLNMVNNLNNYITLTVQSSSNLGQSVSDSATYPSSNTLGNLGQSDGRRMSLTSDGLESHSRRISQTSEISHATTLILHGQGGGGQRNLSKDLNNVNNNNNNMNQIMGSKINLNNNYVITQNNSSNNQSSNNNSNLNLNLLNIPQKNSFQQSTGPPTVLNSETTSGWAAQMRSVRRNGGSQPGSKDKSGGEESNVSFNLSEDCNGVSGPGPGGQFNLFQQGNLIFGKTLSQNSNISINGAGGQQNAMKVGKSLSQNSSNQNIPFQGQIQMGKSLSWNSNVKDSTQQNVEVGTSSTSGSEVFPSKKNQESRNIVGTEFPVPSEQTQSNQDSNNGDNSTNQNYNQQPSQVQQQFQQQYSPLGPSITSLNHPGPRVPLLPLVEVRESFSAFSDDLSSGITTRRVATRRKSQDPDANVDTDTKPTETLTVVEQEESLSLDKPINQGSEIVQSRSRSREKKKIFQNSMNKTQTNLTYDSLRQYRQLIQVQPSVTSLLDVNQRSKSSSPLSQRGSPKSTIYSTPPYPTEDQNQNSNFLQKNLLSIKPLQLDLLRSERGIIQQPENLKQTNHITLMNNLNIDKDAVSFSPRRREQSQDQTNPVQMLSPPKLILSDFFQKTKNIGLKKNGSVDINVVGPQVKIFLENGPGNNDDIDSNMDNDSDYLQQENDSQKDQIEMQGESATNEVKNDQIGNLDQQAEPKNQAISTELDIQLLQPQSHEQNENEILNIEQDPDAEFNDVQQAAQEVISEIQSIREEIQQQQQSQSKSEDSIISKSSAHRIIQKAAKQFNENDSQSQSGIESGRSKNSSVTAPSEELPVEDQEEVVKENEDEQNEDHIQDQKTEKNDNKDEINNVIVNVRESTEDKDTTNTKLNTVTHEGHTGGTTSDNTILSPIFPNSQSHADIILNQETGGYNIRNRVRNRVKTNRTGTSAGSRSCSPVTVNITNSAMSNRSLSLSLSPRRNFGVGPIGSNNNMISGTTKRHVQIVLAGSQSPRGQKYQYLDKNKDLDDKKDSTSPTQISERRASNMATPEMQSIMIKQKIQQNKSQYSKSLSLSQSHESASDSNKMINSSTSNSQQSATVTSQQQDIKGTTVTVIDSETTTTNKAKQFSITPLVTRTPMIQATLNGKQVTHLNPANQKNEIPRTLKSPRLVNVQQVITPIVKENSNQHSNRPKNLFLPGITMVDVQGTEPIIDRSRSRSKSLSSEKRKLVGTVFHVPPGQKSEDWTPSMRNRKILMEMNNSQTKTQQVQKLLKEDESNQENATVGATTQDTGVNKNNNFPEIQTSIQDSAKLKIQNLNNPDITVTVDKDDNAAHYNEIFQKVPDPQESQKWYRRKSSVEVSPDEILPAESSHELGKIKFESNSNTTPNTLQRQNKAQELQMRIAKDTLNYQSIMTNFMEKDSTNKSDMQEVKTESVHLSDQESIVGPMKDSINKHITNFLPQRGEPINKIGDENNNDDVYIGTNTIDYFGPGSGAGEASVGRASGPKNLKNKSTKIIKAKGKAKSSAKAKSNVLNSARSTGNSISNSPRKLGAANNESQIGAAAKPKKKNSPRKENKIGSSSMEEVLQSPQQKRTGPSSWEMQAQMQELLGAGSQYQAHSNTGQQNLNQNNSNPNQVRQESSGNNSDLYQQKLTSSSTVITPLQTLESSGNSMSRVSNRGNGSPLMIETPLTVQTSDNSSGASPSSGIIASIGNLGNTKSSSSQSNQQRQSLLTENLKSPRASSPQALNQQQIIYLENAPMSDGSTNTIAVPLTGAEIGRLRALERVKSLKQQQRQQMSQVNRKRDFFVNKSKSATLGSFNFNSLNGYNNAINSFDNVDVEDQQQIGVEPAQSQRSSMKMKRKPELPQFKRSIQSLIDLRVIEDEEIQNQLGVNTQQQQTEKIADNFDVTSSQPMIKENSLIRNLKERFDNQQVSKEESIMHNINTDANINLNGSTAFQNQNLDLDLTTNSNVIDNNNNSTSSPQRVTGGSGSSQQSLQQQQSNSYTNSSRSSSKIQNQKKPPVFLTQLPRPSEKLTSGVVGTSDFQTIMRALNSNRKVSLSQRSKTVEPGGFNQKKSKKSREKLSQQQKLLNQTQQMQSQSLSEQQAQQQRKMNNDLSRQQSQNSNSNQNLDSSGGGDSTKGRSSAENDVTVSQHLNQIAQAAASVPIQPVTSSRRNSINSRKQQQLSMKEQMNRESNNNNNNSTGSKSNSNSKTVVQAQGTTSSSLNRSSVEKQQDINRTESDSGTSSLPMTSLTETNTSSSGVNSNRPSDQQREIREHKQQLQQQQQQLQQNQSWSSSNQSQSQTQSQSQSMNNSQQQSPMIQEKIPIVMAYQPQQDTLMGSISKDYQKPSNTKQYGRESLRRITTDVQTQSTTIVPDTSILQKIGSKQSRITEVTEPSGPDSGNESGVNDTNIKSSNKNNIIQQTSKNLLDSSHESQYNDSGLSGSSTSLTHNQAQQNQMNQKSNNVVKLIQGSGLTNDDLRRLNIGSSPGGLDGGQLSTSLSSTVTGIQDQQFSISSPAQKTLAKLLNLESLNLSLSNDNENYSKQTETATAVLNTELLTAANQRLAELQSAIGAVLTEIKSPTSKSQIVGQQQTEQIIEIVQNQNAVNHQSQTVESSESDSNMLKVNNIVTSDIDNRTSKCQSHWGQEAQKSFKDDEIVESANVQTSFIPHRRWTLPIAMADWKILQKSMEDNDIDVNQEDSPTSSPIILIDNDSKSKSQHLKKALIDRKISIADLSNVQFNTQARCVLGIQSSIDVEVSKVNENSNINDSTSKNFSNGKQKTAPGKTSTPSMISANQKKQGNSPLLFFSDKQMTEEVSESDIQEKEIPEEVNRNQMNATTTTLQTHQIRRNLLQTSCSTGELILIDNLDNCGTGGTCLEAPINWTSPSDNCSDHIDLNQDQQVYKEGQHQTIIPSDSVKGDTQCESNDTIDTTNSSKNNVVNKTIEANTPPRRPSPPRRTRQYDPHAILNEGNILANRMRNGGLNCKFVEDSSDEFAMLMREKIGFSLPKSLQEKVMKKIQSDNANVTVGGGQSMSSASSSISSTAEDKSDTKKKISYASLTPLNKGYLETQQETILLAEAIAEGRGVEYVKERDGMVSEGEVEKGSGGGGKRVLEK